MLNACFAIHTAWQNFDRYSFGTFWMICIWIFANQFFFVYGFTGFMSSCVLKRTFSTTRRAKVGKKKIKHASAILVEMDIFEFGVWFVKRWLHSQDVGLVLARQASHMDFFMTWGWGDLIIRSHSKWIPTGKKHYFYCHAVWIRNIYVCECVIGFHRSHGSHQSNQSNLLTSITSVHLRNRYCRNQSRQLV